MKKRRTTSLPLADERLKDDIELDDMFIHVCQRLNKPWFEIRSCGTVLDFCANLETAKSKLSATKPLREIWKHYPNGRLIRVVPAKFSQDFTAPTIFAGAKILRGAA